MTGGAQLRGNSAEFHVATICGSRRGFEPVAPKVLNISRLAPDSGLRLESARAIFGIQNRVDSLQDISLRLSAGPFPPS